VDRHFEAAAAGQQDPDPARLRGQAHPLTLQPGRFAEDDLPPPRLQDVDQFRTFFGNPSHLLQDESAAATQLCISAYGLDVFSVRYLLLQLGVAGDLKAPQYAGSSALHCLAQLYTMADAHGRSHVFALLKGKDSWLTGLLPASLPLKLGSVLSRDIKDPLEEESVSVARWLLRGGVPLDGVDGGGNTALHHACQGGNLQLARLLLQAGADPNTLNLEKRSALHYAVAFGHAQLAGLLVEQGANLDQRDRNGVRPIDMLANPGAILPEDAQRFLNITQRPVRRIERVIHPELGRPGNRTSWVGGTGGWGAERLPGFEQDMDCDCIDQFFADEISGQEIFDRYIARNAPVLIRGLLDDWKAVQDYRMERLLSEHGQLRVQVSDIPYAQKFGGSTMVDMTLAEYVAEVAAHRIVGGKHPWYVFKGHPVPAVAEAEQSLVPFESCPTPKSIAAAFDKTLPMAARGRQGKKGREAFINAQWALGGEGTGAPIHFHNTAWSALIYGAKKWLIYPPHNQIMSNKQILDFFETDMKAFQQRDVRPVTCVQTAGDVLIIPENWGHGVLNLQESVAVASEAKTGTWRLRPVHPIYEKFPGFRNSVRNNAAQHPPPPKAGI